MKIRVRECGFSLIELLIVVAIVTIIASIATASYFYYIERAKISSIVTLMNHYKTQSQVYYEQHGVWPAMYTLNHTGDGIDSIDDPNPFLSAIIMRPLNCGNMEIILNSANIGNGEYMAYSIYYDYVNGSIQTSCECETDLGWGTCDNSSLPSALQTLNCGLYITDQEFSC